MKLLFSFIFLTFLNVNLYSLEPTYSIGTINFHVQGRTQVSALERFVQKDLKQTFSDEVLLIAALDETKRRLANTRLFLKIDFTMTKNMDEDPEGHVYTVDFYLEESKGIWIIQANTLPLPVATFDSNYGVIVGAGYQDQNFFGTLSEFRLNGEYRNLVDGSAGLWVFGSLQYPLGTAEEPSQLTTAFNLGLDLSGQDPTWVDMAYQHFVNPWVTALVSGRVAYKFNDQEISGFANAGLEHRFGWNIWSSYLSLSQRFEKPMDGLDSYYALTQVSSGQSFRLIPLSKYFGTSQYSLSSSAGIYYNPFVELIEPAHQGLVLSNTQSLQTNGVYWEGLFKNGGLISFSHSLAFKPTEVSLLYHLVKGEFQSHFTLGWAGTSLRAIGLWYFLGTKENAGDLIRGVINKRLIAQSSLTTNWDIPLRIPMGPVNDLLELIISPFIDLGYFRATAESPEASGYYGGTGAELIIIPAFAKTALVRVSAGVDLDTLLKQKDIYGSTIAGDPKLELAVALSYFY